MSFFWSYRKSKLKEKWWYIRQLNLTEEQSEMGGDKQSAKKPTKKQKEQTQNLYANNRYIISACNNQMRCCF